MNIVFGSSMAHYPFEIALQNHDDDRLSATCEAAVQVSLQVRNRSIRAHQESLGSAPKLAPESLARLFSWKKNPRNRNGDGGLAK